jgi:hypothetical protein
VECTFGAHEKDELVRTLWKFTEDIKTLGPIMEENSRNPEELKR